MIINLSRIDFGGVATGGGKTKPEETFDVQPTTTDQAIAPTEGSVFSGGTVRAVTSEIDNNIVPGNIKQGVSILGVAGTLVEGITPVGTKTITDNGTYDVTTFASVDVAVSGDTPDYRYAKGTIDKEGLKAIGWTDEDILTYEQNKTPHYTWQNDQYKVSEENKALYLLDDPNPSSYKDNPNITFVPKKNMGFYFAKQEGFINMHYIKGIPFYDTSNVTDMSAMFSNCSSLTTIPQLDTSNVTLMNYMFERDSSLTAIPQLDTSKVTGMTEMFHNCSSLTTIPQLNTSNVTLMERMFKNCSSLTTIPQLDTSNVTHILEMFDGCTNLTTIPQLVTSNVTYMQNMFNNCKKLTTIPQLDTSKVTDMSNMFNGCWELESIPQLDTSNVTSMYQMFYNCDKLITLPPLNTSKVTSMDMMIYCSKLTTVEGIDFSGLTSSPNYLVGFNSNNTALTRFIVNGKINVSISDEYSIKALTAIDYDSVKSILEAANRTDNNDAKTLAFNRSIIDRNGEIAALVTSCTAKGWTITGLTFKPREDVILTCSDVVLTDGKADYVPVTIDAINDWNIARYDGGGVEEGDWLEIKVYENSTVIADAYGSSFDNWEDLTGKTAGINTANLKLGYLIGDRYRALPEGIKLIIYFGIVDSNNNFYKYDITLERIDGQVTTTLHTISPNAK